MPVNSDKWTDARLNAMEKRINGVYSRASKELAEKIQTHFEMFETKDKAKIKALEAQKGKISDEEYKKAEQEYQRWRRTQLFQGEQMKELEKTVAAEMLNANKTAVSYINGELPEIYSINYNGIGDDIASHVKGYSYQLTDAHTVRNLATKNKTLLPYKTVNGQKDARWNTKKVNAEILQGIVQGESIPKIASRLEKVTEMNRVSAIRNARTCVTSAQNKGRLDGMLEAEKKGIILQKKWLSSNQSGRTRDWHFPSSFESLEVDTDKPFVNGMGEIMYPGDPSAKPANVYNCRCTMVTVVKGFKKLENAGESVDITAKSGIINTGAQSGAKKTEGWQNRHADRMYEEIRHRTTDAAAISKNTVFTEKAATEIKQHMFVKEHRFADGSVRRFDPDFEQAQAWDRLAQGNGSVSDLVLLKHEYVELTQMRLHNYDYETAHEIANKYHNWAKIIVEEASK